MNITIYNFTKRRNSTKRPDPTIITEQGINVDVTLKENTSIYTPYFLLSAVYHDKKYLKWDGRFYFIDDEIKVSNELIEIHCSVDVMGTLKYLIGESTQFVTRAAGAHNQELIDELTIPYGNRYFDTVLSSEIFTATDGYYCVGFSFSSGLTYSCHVGAVQYVFMNASQLSEFSASIMSGSWGSDYVNPIQYVVSCIYIPFPRTFSAVLTDTIKIGLNSFTIKHYAMPNTPLEYIFHESLDVPSNQFATDIDGTYRYYMNLAPFLDLTLYAGPFGTIKIPTEMINILGERVISYSIYIDYTTGKGKLFIYKGRSANVEQIINIIDGQLGAPVQLSQITSGLNLSNSLAAGSSLLTAGAGIMTSNPLLTGSGAAGVISAAANMQTQTISSKGSNGSVIDVIGNKIILQGAYFKAFTYDKRDFGMPYCNEIRIDTLSGFIKTADANLYNASSYDFSTQLLDQAKSIMDAGFFYE